MCNVGVGSFFRQAELHSVVTDQKQRPWLLGRVRPRCSYAVIRCDRTPSLRSGSRCLRRGIEGRCEENGHRARDGASNNNTVHQQFSIHR